MTRKDYNILASWAFDNLSKSEYVTFGQRLWADNPKRFSMDKWEDFYGKRVEKVKLNRAKLKKEFKRELK